MHLWKDWALIVCYSTVAAGIVSMLLPKGKNGTTGRVAVSMFILCTLIKPLQTIQNDFTHQLKESDISTQKWYEELQEDSDDLAYSLAESHILKLIQTHFETLEIPTIQLDVEFLMEDDEPELSIEILLSDEHRQQESMLRDLLIQNYSATTVHFIWQEDK